MWRLIAEMATENVRLCVPGPVVRWRMPLWSILLVRPVIGSWIKPQIRNVASKMPLNAGLSILTVWQMGLWLIVNKQFKIIFPSIRFSSDQSLSHVRLFVTPRIAARQASLSITNSRHLLKLMSIESVMPSNHLILCLPLLLLPPIPPSIRVFSNESIFAGGGRSIRVSALASVLPMNTQDWFPLGWTGWISLQSKALSRVSSNSTVQKHQCFCAHLTL